MLKVLIDACRYSNSWYFVILEFIFSGVRLGCSYKELKSRLYFKPTPPKFNPLTLGLHRVTRTQRMAIKRRQPAKLDPLVGINKNYFIFQ